MNGVKRILFVSRKAARGGAIYENEVKNVLEKHYEVDTLNLDTSKNKLLYFNKLKYYFQIRSFKPSKLYDVVIANRAAVYGSILKKKSAAKVLILHHYNPVENRHVFARSFLKNKFLSGLNSFTRIVIVSEYWNKYVARYADVNKIRIIYNSFDTTTISTIIACTNKEEFKKKFSIPADKLIVYAGNALKEKGYQKVLDKLSSNNEFFIITSGSRDENAGGHLHLTLNYKEYIQLLFTADVTVILSDFEEGWNRIAHESLLCHTPVIGSGTAGFGQLLTEAQQVIYKEGENLSDLIYEIINNNYKTQKGYEFASRFDLNYFENAWNKLVAEL